MGSVGDGTERAPRVRRSQATTHRRAPRSAPRGAATVRLPADGRNRVVIERVTPRVDDGRFPIKRTVGEQVEVEADVFADGHDVLAAAVRWRREEEPGWRETAMEPLGNDRWRAVFTVEDLGRYRYTVAGWVAPYATWRRDLATKLDADVAIGVEALEGQRLIEGAAKRATGDDADLLRAWADELAEGGAEAAARAAGDEALTALMEAHEERALPTEFPAELEVWVEPERARFSAWY